MTSDPRAVLATLVAAFERHLEAAASKSGEDDPTVIAAYEDLADAFESYDEALLVAYGEMTPLDLYDEAEEEIDDHSDEDGDGAIYSGLDDSDYDEDDEDEGEDDDQEASR